MKNIYFCTSNEIKNTTLEFGGLLSHFIMMFTNFLLNAEKNVWKYQHFNFINFNKKNIRMNLIEKNIRKF